MKNICLKEVEICIIKNVDEEKKRRKWIIEYIWEIINKHNNVKKSKKKEY
jgi:hypothetical protein